MGIMKEGDREVHVSNLIKKPDSMGDIIIKTSASSDDIERFDIHDVHDTGEDFHISKYIAREVDPRNMSPEEYKRYRAEQPCVLSLWYY